MDSIRVPDSALEWIADALAGSARCRRRFGSPQVPTGVTFDAVAFGTVEGTAVLNRLLDDRRHVGPVVKDGGRVLFLVAPSGENGLERRRIEHRVPHPLDVSGAGRTVRLPPPVTLPDAPRRWLIAPRSRQPRLTAVDDLLTAVAAHAATRRRAGRSLRMPPAAPSARSRSET
jgi:hypothetical protein